MATACFTAASIGFLFTFIGTIIAVIQGVLIGKVVKRVGERRIIPVAIAGILNPLPLLLTGKLLSDRATAKETRGVLGAAPSA